MSNCTPGVPCPMRVKVSLVALVLPAERCGVLDSELVDFVVFDKVSACGAPVLRFRFCPWCGQPWHWQGKTHEILKPK